MPVGFSVGASSTGDFLAILYGDQINVLSWLEVSWATVYISHLVLSSRFHSQYSTHSNERTFSFMGYRYSMLQVVRANFL